MKTLFIGFVSLVVLVLDISAYIDDKPLSFGEWLALSIFNLFFIGIVILELYNSKQRKEDEKLYL